jgi:hypothetical protein
MMSLTSNATISFRDPIVTTGHAMKMIMRAIVVVVALAACPLPTPALDVEAGCQPLLGVHCALPYPSDFFVIDDATLPSGKRVVVDDAAKLFDSQGRTFAPTSFLPQDGFSRINPIVVSFGVAIDPSTVPGFFADPQQTLAPSFPIALIEAATGTRVPFFIDIDPRSRRPDRQAMIIRPLGPLQELTRYVVAISGLNDVDGHPVPVGEGFRRLRDRESLADPALQPLLRFEQDVFPVAVGAGLARDRLQLAWDFTVGSDDNATDDMLRARSLALAALAATPPVVTITSLLQGENLTLRYGDELTWRVVEGTIVGPRVVDGDDTGARLFRDDQGEVALNDTTTIPFTAVVPSSLRDRFGSAPVTLYGHGFFGSRNEVTGDAARALADNAGEVFVAIDWVGMADDDIGTLLDRISNDLTETLLFGERLPQAMVDWLTVTDAIQRGLLTMATDSTGMAPLRRPLQGVGVSTSAGQSNADVALFPTAPIHMMGISQGHILAGTAVALNAAVERAIFHVGGAGFSHLMYRARPFAPFLLILDSALPDALDQQVLTAQLQRGFDRFDPATYARYVLHDDLPLGPAGRPADRRVLLQVGVGDSQVPTIGALLHARALDIPIITPTVTTVGRDIDHAPSPRAGSGLALFDLGIDTAFLADATPADNGNRVHDGLRTTAAARLQQQVFLEDGIIINPCLGPCGVLEVR